MKLLHIGHTDADGAWTQSQVSLPTRYMHFTSKQLITYLQVKLCKQEKSESKYNLLVNTAFGHLLHENKVKN